MSIAANKLIKIEDVWLVHCSTVENLKLLNFSFNLIQKQTPLFLHQTKTEAKHVDIFTADCGVSAENKWIRQCCVITFKGLISQSWTSLSTKQNNVEISRVFFLLSFTEDLWSLFSEITFWD